MDEADHADLDDLVAAMIKAGRLDIDDDCDELAGSGSVGDVHLPRLQPAQNPIIV